MLVLVTYDVNTENSQGKRRLRMVSRICVRKGRRVQNSVFECYLDNAEYHQLKNDLAQIIDSNHDSLRFYNLGNKYQNKVETLGRDRGYDPEDVLMV